MTWATITGAGTTTATKFFGDITNKFSNMFNGSDVTDTVSINTAVTWTFKGAALRVRNAGDTFSYIFSGGAIVADRTITLPLLTGADVLVTADFIQTLKNKKLEDTSTSIVDDGDNTKALKFQCVGITTGNTRVLTIPDFDGTISTLAGTETLTGKTLTGNIAVNLVSGAATVTLPTTTSSLATLGLAETFTGEKTFGTAGGAVSKLIVSGATSGSTIIDATAVAGSGTVTLPTTGTLATLAGAETLAGKTLTEPKFVDLGFIADANGNELLILDTVTSAVNEIKLSNSATLNPVLLTASGETNVSVQLVPKGTGTWFGNRETFSYPLTDETTLPTTGVKYVTEPAPYDMLIEDVIIGVTTAGTGATLFTLDALKETSVNGNAWSTIFTTKPTIDASEFTSTTAAAAMSLTTTTWEKGRRMQLKIYTLDSNSLARGAKISLICHATAK